MRDFRTDRFTDFVRGVALGDSLGMLGENLHPRQVAKLYRGDIRQKMPFGRGFVSDETEQVFLTARALCRRSRYLPLRISFRRELLCWLSTMPIGAGSSTVRSCLSIALMSRLRLATSLAPGGPSKGNGPLLRAATIGLLLETDNIDQAAAWTTLLTHTSLEAVTCSVIVARIFNQLTRPEQLPAALSPDLFREATIFARCALRVSHSDYGWQEQIAPFVASLEPAFAIMDLVHDGELTVDEGLGRLGSGDGVSGHVTQTLTAALLIAVRHRDDVNAAADAAIRAGGDTDSVAALACGLVATAAWVPQEYSRLKLWRDPYAVSAASPPSGEALLAAVARRRHRLGMLAEHLALMFVAGPFFLSSRALARWGW